MTLADQIESLTEQLATANDTIAGSANAKTLQALHSENRALRSERDTSASQLATARTRIAELESTRANAADLVAKLDAASAEIGRLKVDLETTRKSVDARASAIATELMATVGQPVPLKHDARAAAADSAGDGIGYAEYIKKLPNKK